VHCRESPLYYYYCLIPPFTAYLYCHHTSSIAGEMSDSDWEVLSTEEERHDLVPASAATTEQTADLPADVSSSPSPRFAASRRSALTPLCLTLNQTGTRLGVGHTKGFLVFRVVDVKADETAAPLEAQRTATECVLPAQSQLVLEPQYNVDLQTFSRVRERMRQQQQLQQGGAQQHATSAAPTAGTAPESTVNFGAVKVSPAAHGGEGCAARCVDSVIGEHDMPSMKVRMGEANAHEASDAKDSNSGSPLLKLHDLGSFLDAAGRAFTRIHRSDPKDDIRTEPTRRRAESREIAVREMEDSEAADSTPSTSEDSRRAHPHAAAETAIFGKAGKTTLLSDPPTAALQPSSVLAWGDGEDIDLDVLEGSVNDLPLSSISDCAQARRRHRKSCGSTGAWEGSGGANMASVLQAHTAEDEEEENSFIGFAGGGVAVLSLLYHQTWVALVGGGPTPMGPANEVHLVRDGERQHRLTMPHPVVRLFLDARLLFVVTTAELRVYTNPLENNWVCLRQRITISAALATRYISVPLRRCEASPGKDAGEQQQQCFSGLQNASPTSTISKSCGATVDDTPQRSAALFAAAGNTETTVATTPGHGVALPSIPIAVDYARSLLLLPVGDACTGFALYRYFTGPEPARQPADTTTAVGGASEAENIGGDTYPTCITTAVPEAATTGRTTAYLQHVATQRAAHRNPLHNLVLYVGWPTATTRLLSTVDTPPAITTTPRASRGGPVTLVAASSEYATRLTLWMLADSSNGDGDGDGDGEARQPSSHGASRSVAPASGFATPTAAGSFVLLREFRVGLRLSAPKVVKAALPGVAWLMARAQHSANAEPPSSPCERAGCRSNAGGCSDFSQTPSTASLARTGRSGGRGAGAVEGEDSNGGPAAHTPAATPWRLPRDPASSSTSHRGTVASWAADVASAVTACATASPSVYHLQFIANGAYLLCVHGTDTISVFSTSAPESQQEAKDVTRDRAVAEHNRYSSLSLFKGYLPTPLSTRLDTYTRQAWSSCSGHLPVLDAAFAPRWYNLTHHDAPAPAAMNSRGTPTNKSAAPNNDRHASISSSAVVSQPSTSRDDTAGVRRFFWRPMALVAARSQPQPQTSSTAAATLTTAQPASPLSLSSPLDSQQASMRHSPSVTEQPLASQSSPSTEPHDATSSVYWGTPLTELPQCICIWSSPSSLSIDASHGSVKSGRGGALAGGGRRPIVLNCATCEGAFTNVLLFTEEGEITTSRVVPYAGE
jgi:hypothetical protein